MARNLLTWAAIVALCAASWLALALPFLPERIPTMLQHLQFTPARSCECSGCETQHNSPDGGLPVGWSKQKSSAWCPDCTRAGVPARAAAKPRAA